ncbi:MAG: WcaI family glycosyltransferase, partial [Proteobacteria bacterium]|nr:WcaI family glycosyltransferase [Pseudomonadota bacterium]
FEADVAFELGLMRSPLIRGLVKFFECHLMRRFDVVSAISPQMCEQLLRKGVEAHRIELFENGVDTDVIYPLDGPSPMRGELAIEAGTVVALYAGNMGQKQGLETLIGAARRLAGRSDILILLAGEGVMRGAMEAAAETLDNVRILPLQPLSRFNDLLNLADIHLLPQRRDATDLVMPSKLLGMLASGRPVVAGAQAGSGIAALVEGRGLIVEAENITAMAGAIEILADDPEKRVALGRAARQSAVDRSDMNSILSRFNEITRDRRKSSS